MRFEKLIIAVDFDGTLVEHEYPRIGMDTGGAYWLRRAQREGDARLILWTMRSGELLQDAADWCQHNGLRLFGLNANPLQGTWSQSPKAFANVYIDDNAFGCPLVQRPGRRPYVDWTAVGPAILFRAQTAKQDAERQG